MTAPTLARIPADASDDLVLRLYQETARQTPDGQRSTCQIHLNWVDKCSHLHGEGARRG
ncbi:hypothetical protein [Streptomyces resistomycificus]|uniref:hypothetical protein n=1 Tax=Streptomyces resistomycificus TaxID=67356 RepID=UPI000B036F2C|nr:hypothetical protein [Streptomyces resistomycificus]